MRIGFSEKNPYGTSFYHEDDTFYLLGKTKSITCGKQGRFYAVTELRSELYTIEGITPSTPYGAPAKGQKAGSNLKNIKGP